MESQFKGNKRFLFGIVLIAIGGIWILEQLGLIPSDIREVLISWQMLMIFIGIFSLFSGSKTLGWVLIAFGAIFMIPLYVEVPLEIIRLKWPLLLVALGVIMLIRYNVKPETIAEKDKDGLNYFDDFVIFGGREIVIDSQDLVGGKCTSVFGGSEYEMRQAKLSSNGAIIDCVSIFGGTGFKIPGDWAVKNEVSTIFGAFTDKRSIVIPDNQDLSKTLIIRGFTAFGGVEIKNI